VGAFSDYKPIIPEPDPGAAGEDGFTLPGSGRGVSAGIARSSFGLTLTMGVVALAELGREIVVARLFGAGPASDAYYLGIAVPLVLRGAMLTVAGQVVLPWLCLSSRGDAEVSHRYTSQLLFLLCGPLVLLALGSGWLAAAIAPWIAGPAIQRPLLVQMLAWALPTLGLAAQTAVLTAYLHSREVYSGAALHTLAGSLVFAGGLVLLRGLPAGRSLGPAFLAGSAAELAWLVILARPTPRALRSWRDLPWRPLRDLLRRSAPPTAAVALRQLGWVVERILAGHLGVGAVAILSYSNRMALGVGKIFTEAMHTVVRSKASRAQARGAGAETAEILTQGSRQMLLLLLPIAACVVVLRMPISRVLFESGEFSTGALVATAGVLAAYAAALPAYGVSPTLMTGFYAAGDVITPSLHQLWMLAANLALDLLFVRWWGVLGIGVAFVVTMMLSVLRAGWLVERRLVRLSLWRDARFFAALLLGVACCVGATWGAWGLLQGLAVHGRPALASVTALAGLVGVAAFAAVQIALGVDELRMLLRWLQAWMRSLWRRS